MNKTNLLRAAIPICNLGDRTSCMLSTIPFFPEDRVTPLNPKHTKTSEMGQRALAGSKSQAGARCAGAQSMCLYLIGIPLGEISHLIAKLLSDGCPWGSPTGHRGNLTINYEDLTIKPPKTNGNSMILSLL